MAISVPGAMAGSSLAALSIPAELVAGTGNPMVKASAFDVAPSPATVMLAVPAVAMSAAGTLAVNWDALTNVVGSGAPFHCTLELAVTPAPVTVRVKAAPAGAAALGLRLASEAAGVVEMDSASTLEGRGPVLETVILAVPGAAIKAADTCAVNCVALTPVVGSGTALHATVASERKLLPLTVSVKSGPPTNTDVALTPVVGSATPFHATVASERKLLPLTVSVKSGPPTNTDAGLRLVMAGVGAFTVKTGAWGETCEPGLTTWMTCDPTLAMALEGTLTVSWFTLT